MSIKSKVSKILKGTKNHSIGFLKYALYVGGPFIILYALGDLIWLVNEKYGSIIFFVLVIYIYIGVAQNKVEKSEFQNNSFNISLMLNIWKNIVIWPIKNIYG
ncbi:hypothetical protein [Pseudoalteromonas sp. AC163]|uniref:hypothetical protein n=1 Tax=Pseudoalteromonas sp. AC163 TaxID=1055790 RepID=UPI0004631F5C|nr:hypothetical protein [Pseudoalteromonas sp. AC163]